MKVTHNKQQYNVTKQSQDEWRLTSVEKPREYVVLSTRQMRVAGLLSWSCVIDLATARAAQSKAAIAQYVGNETMWRQAAEQFRDATGRHLH